VRLTAQIATLGHVMRQSVRSTVMHAVWRCAIPRNAQISVHHASCSGATAPSVQIAQLVTAKTATSNSALDNAPNASSAYAI
jgi:uncharacterized lipoprotein YbaY